MKVALDTNILAYAEGVNGLRRRRQALDLIGRLPGADVTVSIQVLGELFNVLVRKAGRPHQGARDSVLGWKDAFAATYTTSDVLLGATDLVVDHRLGVWDAVIVSAASVAGCRVLLSEDLNEGFTWRGVTVVNPFAEKHHELLSRLLEDA